MAHTVKDTDTHFIIDGTTRLVKNETETKTMLVQYDHNSERFTFRIKRYIDSHDLSLCNVVRVHYINIEKTKRLENKGVYVVDDLAVCADDNEYITCSWLISDNATQYVGSLHFVVQFACMEGDKVKYSWNTAKHTSVSIVEGISNGETIVSEYADILQNWEDWLKANSLTSLKQTKFGDDDGDENIWTATFGDGRTSELKVKNGDTKKLDYANMTVGNATKATNDSDGKKITDTYAKQNGTYANMSVGNATNATSATNATNATNDSDGKKISDTYAKKDGKYADLEAGYATKAGTATKATKDTDGNDIHTTYAKQNSGETTYSNMKVGNATNATNATNDSDGKKITDTYVKRVSRSGKTARIAYCETAENLATQVELRSDPLVEDTIVVRATGRDSAGANDSGEIRVRSRRDIESNPDSLAPKTDYVAICKAQADKLYVKREEGGQRSAGFLTFDEMNNHFKNAPQDAYFAGQSVYINEQTFPSLWIYGVGQTQASKVYASDTEALADLNKFGAITIGYYNLSLICSAQSGGGGGSGLTDEQKTKFDALVAWYDKSNYKNVSIGSFTNALTYTVTAGGTTTTKTASAIQSRTLEKGSKVTMVDLAWSITNEENLVSLTLTRGSTKEDVKGKYAKAFDYSGSPIYTDTTWTLTPKGKNNEGTDLSTSVSFSNRVYYGVASEPTVYNSSFLNSLSNEISGMKSSITATAGASQYIYYCQPSSYATKGLVFSFGIIEGGFAKVATISHTNNAGYTENFDIYRSDQDNLGAKTVTIKQVK